MFLLILVLIFSQTLASPESDFVHASIGKQIELARYVRNIQNHDRILFGNVTIVNYIQIGGYRVGVTDRGSQTFLNFAAQSCFSSSQYSAYLPDTIDILFLNGTVILKRLNGDFNGQNELESEF